MSHFEGSIRSVKILNGLIALLATAAVGAFTGWLIGASNSPVVATAIPLIFGLTTVALARRDETTPAGDGKRHAWTLGLSSLGAILFVMSAYCGVNRGVALRQERIPPLKELIGGIAISPKESALLGVLRLDLERMNLSGGEVTEFFGSAVVPYLQSKEYGPGGQLADVRFDALRTLREDLKSAQGAVTKASRGPASVKESPP